MPVGWDLSTVPVIGLNATAVALNQVNIPLDFLEFMSRASLGATTKLRTDLASLHIPISSGDWITVLTQSSNCTTPWNC
ncbi:MAG: hypothetical protein J0M33_26980 [Anaerolineae bacterium]|nr:hypothetical protein [Anaerolineae bacterium]